MAKSGKWVPWWQLADVETQLAAQQAGWGQQAPQVPGYTVPVQQPPSLQVQQPPPSLPALGASGVASATTQTLPVTPGVVQQAQQPGGPGTFGLNLPAPQQQAQGAVPWAPGQGVPWGQVPQVPVGGGQAQGWNSPPGPVTAVTGVYVPMAMAGNPPTQAQGGQGGGAPPVAAPVQGAGPGAGPGPAGAGGQGGTSPAPPGVNQTWWDAFTLEHGGQNPLEFYGAQGEGMAEALADLEWSQAFYEMNGYPPGEYEWSWWWYKSRTGKDISGGGGGGGQGAQQAPLWVPPQITWTGS